MQLLDCRVNRLADYAALESKVASEAARLAKQHGVALRVEKEGDPLVVHVTGLAALRKIEPHVADLGFGPPSASPGFRTLFKLARTIDGESTPVLLTEMDRAGGPPPAATEDRPRKTIEERIPGDPVLSPRARFEQVVTPQAVARDA